MILFFFLFLKQNQKREEYKETKAFWQSIHEKATKKDGLKDTANKDTSSSKPIASTSTTSNTTTNTTMTTITSSDEDPIHPGDDPSPTDPTEAIQSRYTRVLKDVLRTDRTHPYFEKSISLENPSLPLNMNSTKLFNVLMTFSVWEWEIGYVQGMNDLCSPLLIVMDNEEETYWCFRKFMERMVRIE